MNRTPKADQRDSAVQMLRANVFMACSSALIGLTSYCCALLMAHILTVSDYSDFSAGQTLLTTVGVTAAAMVPMPLARVVRTFPRGSNQRRDAMAFAVLVSLLTGLAVGGALTAVARLFAGPGVALVIGMSALGLFAIMPVWGWLQGESRFVCYALLSVTEVCLRLIASDISAVVGWGAEGVLASYLAGVAIVVAAGAVLLRRDLSWNSRVLADGKRWRETSAIALVQLMLSALVSIDVMLVAVLAGNTSAGAGYQAIATLGKGPVYVAASTALISFPALCVATPDESRRIIRSTFSSFAWLAVPAAAVLATVPGSLAFHVLPGKYAASFSLLPWLVVAGLELGAVSVLVVVLLGLGRYRRSMAAVGSSAVLVLGGVAAGWSEDAIHGLAIGLAGGGLVAVITVIAFASSHVPRGLGNSAVRALVWLGAGVAALIVTRPTTWLWLITAVAFAIVAFNKGGRTHRQGDEPIVLGSQGLRIVHLGFEDPSMPGAGGGSYRTHEIDRRLVAKGHRLTVLVTRFPGCINRMQDGVEYVHVGLWKGTTRLTRLLGYVLALPVVVHRYRADLVVEDFFAPFSTMAAPLWTGRPTIGMVQWLNAQEKARQYHVPVHLIERFGVRRHRSLIAVSEGTAQRLAELNPGARIAVVSNGVDQDAFAVTEKRGMDVVFVGRLEAAHKGLDLLLEAWAFIAPKIAGQLVIVGSGPDEKFLRELSERLGMAERVRFVGWIGGTEKYRLMAAARLVVVPSRFETFGIVAVEALATGTPVLAFDIPCLREVIPFGCGRLVSPFDVTDFAYSVHDLYWDANWQTRAESIGRQFAQAYNWDALAAKQDKIYRDISASSRTYPSIPVRPRGDLDMTSFNIQPPILRRKATEASARGSGRIKDFIRDSALLGFTLATLMALLARVFGISRSLELWVDEMVYTQLSTSVSRGELPNIFGARFFLHPPGGFIIYGAAIKIFGFSGTDMSIVYDLRWVSAVLGALTVGIVFLLTQRIAGAGIGWICAALLAFDPFVIRNNGRVFLETPATIFIVGGYLLLAGNMSKGYVRPSRTILVITGLLFGYGILTKDIFVLMTILPTILAGLWRATLPWREVAFVCFFAIIPYVSYIIFIGSDGFFFLWLKAKENGIERMVGLEQTTGFNATGAPSLLDRLTVQIGQFGTSYILLILCPIVGIIAARSRYSNRRFIGLCALTMGVFGVYTALFGTFEEQYGYGVMIMSVLGIGVAFAEISESRPERKAMLSAAAALLIVLTITLGVREEVTPDDGFVQARVWVQAHLPVDARVGVTSNTGQWAFRNDPRFGVWSSAAAMLQHKADYILTQSLPTIEGYGYARPEMLEWLEANAASVFRFSGPTNGSLVLWYVNPSILERAANAGVGS